MTKADELTERIKNALVYGTSHPEAYMTKIDELWEKYSETIGFGIGTQVCVDRAKFLAALTEYGEHLKSEAVKVCINLPNGVSNINLAPYKDCAAAIERMEIK